MRYVKTLGAVAALLTVMGAAQAQDAFQMVGTWKGDAIAVFTGANPYRASAGKDANFSEDTIEFTFEVTRQEGNRFTGKSSGVVLTETFVGAISPDNERGLMLDDDGQYDFTVVDADTLDVCYHHQYPTGRVAGCYQIKRQ